MLLGKRPRPQMRRTTSLTEFSLDPSNPEEAPATSETMAQNSMKGPQKALVQEGSSRRNQQGYVGGGGGGGGYGSDGFDYRLMATVSPRPTHKKNSNNLIETPHFLKVCNLCKRRISPGRDIYMYRGDTAFCSLECRQKQMNKDELMEKCALASQIDTPTTATPDSSPTKGGTLAAA